jgi:hypothetical protein
MSALLALLAALSAAGKAPDITSCEREFGGPCCQRAKAPAPPGLEQSALRGVAAAALASGPAPTAGPVLIVAPRPLRSLATQRPWRWLPSTAKVRARWRPGKDVPFLLIEVEKGAFQDREGHPAVMIATTWAVARSGKAAVEPVDANEAESGSASYCVSAAPGGTKIALDHTAEN